MQLFGEFLLINIMRRLGTGGDDTILDFRFRILDFGLGIALVRLAWCESICRNHFSNWYE